MSERAHGRGGRKIHELPPREDVERELRFHLAMREQELIAAGWDAADARAEARRLFGDYSDVKRECNDVAVRHARMTRRTRMWSEIRQDLRYATRWLLREPLFALIAVLTLALGIGATSATFCIVNDVLLAPLPYPDPGRLVAVREANERGQGMRVAWPNFADWRSGVRSLASMSAHYEPVPATVLGGAQPARALVTGVTGDLFRTLGAQPFIGRTFVAEELVPGGRAAVIISESFWRQQLNARPDLNGVALDLEGVSAAVIGVMPASFDFPAGTQLWYPLDRENPAGFGTRSAHNFDVIARLAPGASVETARTELSGIAAQIREREPDSDAVAAAVVDLRDDTIGSSRRPLLILLGASAFVLLVACTNIASALLARAARRQRELAVRTALGAARLRLLRQLLTESLLLAVLGAAAGLALAYALVTIVTVIGPETVPRLRDVSIDGWVLVFTTLLAFATALTFGSLPALRATAAAPYAALQQSGRGTDSPRQQRAWSLLVSAEVALALLLLVGSGLLIRSFRNLLQVDPGFTTEGTLVADIALPGTKYNSAEARVRYYDELLERVRAIPGVQHAALAMNLPLASFDPNGLFDIEGGRDDCAPQNYADCAEGDASYRVVSPGFFETMETPLLRGRSFNASDDEAATDVIIVNQTTAERFFEGRDPIGLRMRTGGMDSKGLEFATVIGVVADVHHGRLDRPPEPAYYLTYRQRPDRIGSMYLLVRGHAAAVLAPPVRNIIRALDPDIAYELSALDDRIGETFADRRFLLLVLGVFAGTALILAAVGIYGVVSFAVAQRTREIGIRVALGAARRTVLWDVARNTMFGVAAGIMVGLISAALLARVTASLLFDVQPIDPLTFAVVALLLAGVAWLAVLVPARRATRVSPLTALRAE